MRKSGGQVDLLFAMSMKGAFVHQRQQAQSVPAARRRCPGGTFARQRALHNRRAPPHSSQGMRQKGQMPHPSGHQQNPGGQVRRRRLRSTKLTVFRCTSDSRALRAWEQPATARPCQMQWRSQSRRHRASSLLAHRQNLRRGQMAPPSLTACRQPASSLTSRKATTRQQRRHRARWCQSCRQSCLAACSVRRGNA